MNNDQLKPLAYAAKTQLSQSGFDVRSGHIHEIIAALLGYQSKAAFLADTAQPSKPKAGMPLVTLLDMQCASGRVTTLLSGIGGKKSPLPGDDKAQQDAAYLIARDVLKCVEAASTVEHIFLGPMATSCENSALKTYARSIVLADPALAGVVDDPKARYQRAIDNGFSEEMADFHAKHLGPLKFSFGSCRAVDGRLSIELEDEYFPVEGEGGLVHVYIEGARIGRNTYVVDRVRVDFLEGEYYDDMPEFGGYISEVSDEW